MKTFTQSSSLLVNALVWPIAATIMLFAFSCKKNDNSNAQLQIRLIDNPSVDVKAVYVDIKEVEIIANDAAPVTLAGIHAGVYNLMELTNGKDTLLADAVIPAGKLSQIRLILGDNNYIITNAGDKIALKTPSAQQSGLKVQVHETLTGGMLYRLVLDFDAARSIVGAGNSGQIILKPVLRILSFQPSGGNIKGVVLPGNIITAVYAIQGLDTVAATFSSIPSGNFFIRDIPAGNYQLSFISADATYLPAQINTSVILGQTTVTDTIRLHP
ncbi:MAG: DUF4382 domain-containing protein [Chitinophagaceae bacterium]